VADADIWGIRYGEHNRQRGYTDGIELSLQYEWGATDDDEAVVIVATAADRVGLAGGARVHELKRGAVNTELIIEAL